MLFKMLWIERTFELNSSGPTKPRQVFVTKSRLLVEKVEEYFLKLLDSLKTMSQPPQDLKRLSQTRKMKLDGEKLTNVDDDTNWRDDLPSKFSDLVDSHFPLFITFDRVSVVDNLS